MYYPKPPLPSPLCGSTTSKIIGSSVAVCPKYKISPLDFNYSLRQQLLSNCLLNIILLPILGSSVTFISRVLVYLWIVLCFSLANKYICLFKGFNNSYCKHLRLYQQLRLSIRRIAIKTHNFTASINNMQ